MRSQGSEGETAEGLTRTSVGSNRAFKRQPVKCFGQAHLCAVPAKGEIESGNALDKNNCESRYRIDTERWEKLNIRSASIIPLLLSVSFVATAAEPDAAYADLTRAYDLLRIKDYAGAIASFEKASKRVPARTDIRKNLAYTLLKTGETDAAREVFGAASLLDPQDFPLALEYAFLCYEAKDEAPARKAEARRIFARVSELGQGDARSTAKTAFNNIDQPLQAGIARWKNVLATSTPSFSAHYELAQLAEAADQLPLAAANYLAAFRLLPERKSVLLELARVEKARGNPEGAVSAWLAASRGGETRAAELAREQMPDRYPFVYEFRNALTLDPKNNRLQRELAYLLLSMSEKDETKSPEAQKEFEQIVQQFPDDYMAASQLGLLYLRAHNEAKAMPLLERVLKFADAATANRVRMALKMPLVLEDRSAGQAASGARLLAEKSYQAGFLRDARRYYEQAREEDPVDATIALKLGWTNNMLHEDAAALRWFGIAKRSADAKVSSEAAQAYKTLLPSIERFRTTLWVYPLYSSRWKDLFGYGQLKSEIRMNNTWVRPYASVRFVGDTRVTTGGYPAQALSESAFIVAGGIATRYWHGAMGWFEAGSALGYHDGTASTDIRGGVSWSRFRGASVLSESSGKFYELNADSVFVSRFQNDLLNNLQTKVGWTASPAAIRTQYFWNTNINVDGKRQYWANFAEFGPGFRFRPSNAPPSLSITVSMMRGVYLINRGNPRGPNFWDFRAGVWYAITK